jgi:hypothetical protein
MHNKYCSVNLLERTHLEQKGANKTDSEGCRLEALVPAEINLQIMYHRISYGK